MRRVRDGRAQETRTIRPEWRATDVVTGVVFNIRAALDPDKGGSEHGRWIDCQAESGVAI